MSIAAAQAQQFYEEVARERRAFTFLADGSFLVFPINGTEVVPFWSSASRLETVARDHARYRGYTPDEITLDDFMAKTLAQLAAEQIRVGVNWSGPRLTGYDLSVDDLRRNLAHWMSKQS